MRRLFQLILGGVTLASLGARPAFANDDDHDHHRDHHRHHDDWRYRHDSDWRYRHDYDDNDVTDEYKRYLDWADESWDSDQYDAFKDFRRGAGHAAHQFARKSTAKKVTANDSSYALAA
jgi:hypothetical protein